MAKSITANMLDAKTRLSALVDMVERGEVAEVLIARDGRPAVRIVPLGRPKIRLGLARKKLTMPDDVDTSDREVLQLFGLDAGDDDATAP